MQVLPWDLKAEPWSLLTGKPVKKIAYKSKSDLGSNKICVPRLDDILLFSGLSSIDLTEANIKEMVQSQPLKHYSF